MLIVVIFVDKTRNTGCLCDIEVLSLHIGFIYRYAHNGSSYIGSTTDVKKRREEHKTNRTNKFGRAIQQHGYHSFKFEILEEIRFGERQELYDLEDVHITKHDRTDAKKPNCPTKVS